MPATTKKRLEPRKKPRQARSQATVAAILAAAARVFATAGYAATTTNHVAERAGVSIGSVYEYFPGKDALLVALTERHVEEAQGALTEVLRDLRCRPRPLDEMVTTLVRTMVELHARDPGLHRVLFEQAPLPPRLRAHIARLEGAFAAEVARLLAAHGLGAADARTAAAMSVQVAEGLTHRLVLHDVPPGGRFADVVEPHVREISLLLLGYLERKRAASSGAPGG